MKNYVKLLLFFCGKTIFIQKRKKIVFSQTKFYEKMVNFGNNFCSQINSEIKLIIYGTDFIDFSDK
ncbi:hypothetical protein BpHYR1_026019 [Brachionus plicatilis]|uniref:Uncharacterized protein n=1 Tax=Brachionus plicatilis TaxID=10195 RepID=A0A3M7PNP8_BRAPC|nr:hypothetical protein BpHYR1_026019 [Brachionus plicatilis]